MTKTKQVEHVLFFLLLRPSRSSCVEQNKKILLLRQMQSKWRTIMFSFSVFVFCLVDCFLL